MRIPIRRVGNSLGVILPKATLTAWGVVEGDSLELTTHGLRSPARRTAHARLDELRRSLSLSVIRQCTSAEIRAQSLANLHRWKKQGTWVSAYDEWTGIMINGSEGELFAAMLGRDDNATRLRQSMPYVGLLAQDEVDRVYEETGS
jgi:antitoxin component of MazEF toxin-antitoxin module